LQNCYDANPHGAGFAWADAGKINIMKGYFDFNALYDDLMEVSEHPVLLHFRMATHGSISVKNCHPFDAGNGCAAAHNGVLNIEPGTPDMTDSESFIKGYLGRFTDKELADKRMVKLVELAIGAYNKVAVLTPNGKFIHYNKYLGVSHKGLWFSNNSFEPAWIGPAKNGKLLDAFDDWYEMAYVKGGGKKYDDYDDLDMYPPAAGGRLW
jgi:glutamine amidotransferase